MNINFLNILLVLILVPLKNMAQVDSTTITYQEYIAAVLKFHPIAKKAELKIRQGDNALLSAKGNLDPTISANWDEKDFDDKLYYRRYNGKFIIPTKTGVDFVGGYENTDGTFLNPENNTDDYGLWNLGIEVNLLQGLLYNDRRAALDRAAEFQSLTINEQNIILNELVYFASKAYHEWQMWYFFENVLLENISIANTYYENTLASYQGGEKTTLDTLEAFIIYQDAQNIYNKNKTSLTRAKQNVENYLWFDFLPIKLSSLSKPENYANNFYDLSNALDLTQLVENHPIIKSYNNKKTIVEISQRLKREKLKPKLKAKYNPLLSTGDNLIPEFAGYNQKFGIDFSMPLLFRSEKADVESDQIKLEEIDYDLQNKRNDLTNKLEGSLENQMTIQDQIEIGKDVLQGYALLLEGENEKFKFGESSVFMLNKRQEKYINSQLKLIELNIKLQKEILFFLFYSNSLL
ncbi:MAG: TolC family protein [Saprospiraceae bacterium]|nr:TolC family protein [Saprospiraceae bacterium]